jgi:hypothetical protein
VRVSATNCDGEVLGLLAPAPSWVDELAGAAEGELVSPYPFGLWLEVVVEGELVSPYPFGPWLEVVVVVGCCASAVVLGCVTVVVWVVLTRERVVVPSSCLLAGDVAAAPLVHEVEVEDVSGLPPCASAVD